MNPIHRLLAVATTTAATTLLLAEAAVAGVTPPYGVSVGTDTSGAHHPISAHSTSFTIGGVFCPGVTLNGDVTTGANGVNPFASLSSSATWTGCSITSSATGWTVHGTTSANSGLTDSISGSIDSVSLAVSGSFCSYQVTGSMAMTFNESATSPTIDVHENSGHLVVSNVTIGCFGMISNGDTVSATGTFDVTSADGAIDVF